jgi:hypothetical protein
MKVIETTYIKADETIDTILLENKIVVYVYYKNGYAFFFDSLDALLNYINGTDVNWLTMIEDDGNAVDSILEELEKGIVNRFD